MRIVYPLADHRIGDKCAALFLAWFYTATLKDLEIVLLDSPRTPANSIDLQKWFHYVPDPYRGLENGSKITIAKGTCEVREGEYQPNLFGNLWVRTPWAVAWLRRLMRGVALPHPGEGIPALVGGELISRNQQILLRCSLIDYDLPPLLRAGNVSNIHNKYTIGVHCLTDATYNTGRNHDPETFLASVSVPRNYYYAVPPTGYTADQVLEEMAQCGTWIGGDTGFTHAFALMHPGKLLLPIYGDDAHCKKQFAHEALPIGFTSQTVTWSSDPIRLHKRPKVVMENHQFTALQVEEVLRDSKEYGDINKHGGLNFLHSGDIGDIIACLPTIREMGGGRLFLTTSAETPKTGYTQLRALLRLLRHQPYLTEVGFYRGEPIDIDFSTHRATGITYGNLAVNQMKWAGAKADTATPWLTTPEAPQTDQIVICRSARHQGRLNWHQAVPHFKDRLAFIGLESEWRQFTRKYGHVRYQPTADFLEVAQAIAGSKAIISNQTACWWVAEGMKHRRVLEKRKPELDDSEFVCPNALHTFGPQNIDELEAFIDG